MNKKQKQELKQEQERTLRPTVAEYLRQHRSFTKEFLEMAPIDTNLLIGLGYVQDHDLQVWNWVNPLDEKKLKASGFSQHPRTGVWG